MKKNRKISVETYTFEAAVEKHLILAFVSDLHGCDNEPIVEALSDYRPDAVLIGGDFIHNDRNCQKGWDFLQKVSELAPSFCSVGNHERKYSGNLQKEVDKRGTVLLDNTSVDFFGVRLGGLSSGYKVGDKQGEFKKTPEPNLHWLRRYSSQSGFKILLCHHPEYYEKYVRQYPINLVLSGHAHGGQWRIFERGLFAPGQGIFPTYTSGLYDQRLLVSRGLGNPRLIPRIANRPEIIILELLKAAPAL